MDVTLTEVKLLVCGWIRWRRVRGVAKAHPEGGPGHQLQLAPAASDGGLAHGVGEARGRFLYQRELGFGEIAQLLVQRRVRVDARVPPAAAPPGTGPP